MWPAVIGGPPSAIKKGAVYKNAILQNKTYWNTYILEYIANFGNEPAEPNFEQISAAFHTLGDQVTCTIVQHHFQVNFGTNGIIRLNFLSTSQGLFVFHWHHGNV